MMQRGQNHRAAFTEAQRAHMGAPTSSRIEPRPLREEAEAIKLLSAEIMDAYGLCRPERENQPPNENP
jgi:hypothetical protein